MAAVNMERVAGAKESGQAARKKVIVDCDPGIDDMMAIFMVLQVPEIEVIGLTSTFGNVPTTLATTNCLYLLELAGFPDVPVAEGVSGPLGGGKPKFDYKVHGNDGLGDIDEAKPKGRKLDISAAEFLVQKTAEFPGEVTVITLAPLTNIALAINKDKRFVTNVKQLVVLGGRYYKDDEVNRKAECNMECDAEAAKITFRSGMNTVVTGTDLTEQVMFIEQDLIDIGNSKGKNGEYVSKVCMFYLNWHRNLEDPIEGMILHDPTAMAVFLDPTLFTSRKEAVSVETEEPRVGYTNLQNAGDVPQLSINHSVNAEAVKSYIKYFLCRI